MHTATLQLLELQLERVAWLNRYRVLSESSSCAAEWETEEVKKSNWASHI